MEVSGRGGVVMTDLSQRTSRLELAAPLDGELSIRDSQGLLVAELRKRGGRPLTVAVPPGRYTLRLRRDEGVYKTRVDVDADRTHLIDAEAMAVVSLERTRLRGPSTDTWRRTHHGAAHLAPTLGTYGRPYDVRLQGFSFNALGVVHAELTGFDLGGASVTRGDLHGVSLQFGASWVEGRLQGFQLGALARARDRCRESSGGRSPTAAPTPTASRWDPWRGPRDGYKGGSSAP